MNCKSSKANSIYNNQVLKEMQESNVILKETYKHMSDDNLN